MTMSEAENSIARPTIAFRIGIGAIITVIIQTVAVIAFLVQLRGDVDYLKARNDSQDKEIAVLQSHAQRLFIVEERQSRVLETLRESGQTLRDNASRLEDLRRTLDRLTPYNPNQQGPRLQSVPPP